MNSAGYDSALAFLLGRIDYERAPNPAYGERGFKLDRMHELLARLGHPERRHTIVHITGTKGKGSTAAFAAAMLTAAGYRTGLFTSPHLVRVEERFTVNGHQCAADEFTALVELLRPEVEQLDRRALPGESGPTYFELTTALAWLHFTRQAVDVVVLEVGMGGRLDSTNVCQPAVSVIVSISFDHTKQLGPTLAAIAGEKAGIIKPGVPVVSGVLDDEPRSVIADVARQRGCRLVQLGEQFGYEYRPGRHGEYDLRASEPRVAGAEADLWVEQPSGATRWERLSLGLIGRHQAANAAVALAAMSELKRVGLRLPDESLRQGLQAVRWPARIEVLRHQPTVILDAAHNLASIAALVATLAEGFSARQRTVVFATTRDKDVRGMLQILVGAFDRLVLTRYSNNPRGVPVDELAVIAGELGRSDAMIEADAATAWRRASLGLTVDDLICVTGSFFIAAELRGLMVDDQR